MHLKSQSGHIGTQTAVVGDNVTALRLRACLLAVGLMVAGCGQGTTQRAATASSPRTSPVASPSGPSSAGTSFGVLATTSGDNYTVSLISAAGKVVGSAQASSPTAVTCGDLAASVLPLPISTSNNRVYYMDAQGVVRFLTSQGETGRATTVPAGGQRRSTFAVSPDDQRIAVVVSEFTSTGAATRLYVQDLSATAAPPDIFTESGAFGLWPVGWHGDSLVVAKVPSCSQGGGFGCCGPLELHVVDPATATRRFTIGGTDCIIGGPSTPVGAVCETPANTARVLDWTGLLLRTIAIPGPGPIYLSPDGRHLAYSTDATNTTIEGGGSVKMDVCGWIDSTHIFSGGDATHQPRVGDTSSGKVAPVSALGTCAGRLPGGL